MRGKRYSAKFKSQMVQKMTGPGGPSANALSGEVGIAVSTLARWRREADMVPRMTKKEANVASTRTVVARRGSSEPMRPEDWSWEEKLRAVMAAKQLGEDDLGEFLRCEGLHGAHLKEWTEDVSEALSSPAARRRKTSKEQKENRELRKELRRKERALAEAGALLVLQKKLRNILGAEDDDMAARSDD